MHDKTHAPGLPGPWHSEGEDEGEESYEIFHSPMYRAAIMCGHAVIADVRLSDYTEYRTPAEADAIVRLMVAAPDLLLACELVRDWIEHDNIACGPVVWAELCRALAKASPLDQAE